MVENPKEIAYYLFLDPIYTDWQAGNYGEAIGGSLFVAVEVVVGAKGVASGAKAATAAIRSTRVAQSAGRGVRATSSFLDDLARTSSKPRLRGPRPRADFVVGPDGTAIPTSATRLEAGLDAAGFPRRPTVSPGVEFTLPDGNLIRIMQPTAKAPLHASFTNASGGPINPFTGKPPQPPPGLTRAQRLEWVRSYTHLELGP